MRRLARFLSVAAIVLGCGFMLLQDVYYYLVVYVFYFNTFLLEHTVLAYCSIFSDILSIVVIFLVTAAMEAAALRLPEEQGETFLLEAPWERARSQNATVNPDGTVTIRLELETDVYGIGQPQTSTLTLQVPAGQGFAKNEKEEAK